MPPTMEPPKAPVAAPTTSQNPPPLSQPTSEVKTPPNAPPEPKKAPPTPFEELDALAGIEPPTPKVDKVEDKKDEVSTEPVEDKDVAPVNPETKAGNEPETKPAGTAKELRAALDNHKKQVQQLKAELEAIKKGKPAEDPEKKTLLERVQQEEERRKTLEKELGTISYEKSEDYKEKFIVPMDKAFKFAYSQVAQLPALDSEGNERPSTKEDFRQLLFMDAAKASKAAKEVFGDAAPEVLAHRRKILELEEDRKASLEHHQANRAQWEANQKIEMERAAKQSAELWQKTIQEQVEKYPQFFGPEEGDEEGNEALKKGFELTDYLYSNPNIPVEKKIELHAVVRNKAAAFDRLAIRHKRLNTRLAELEKELEGFKASVPAGSDAGGQATPPSTADWAAELDALANGKA